MPSEDRYLEQFLNDERTFLKIFQVRYGHLLETFKVVPPEMLLEMLGGFNQAHAEKVSFAAHWALFCADTANIEGAQVFVAYVTDQLKDGCESEQDVRSLLLCARALDRLSSAKAAGHVYAIARKNATDCAPFAVAAIDHLAGAR